MPGKETQDFPDERSYIDAYKLLLKKLETTDKLDVESKENKIKQLHVSNQETLKNVQPYINQQLILDIGDTLNRIKG